MSRFVVGSVVSFILNKKVVHGTVMDIRAGKALVEAEDRRLFRISFCGLDRSSRRSLPDGWWRRIPPIGSTVSLGKQDDRHVGTIVKLRPKYAYIVSRDKTEWRASWAAVTILKKPAVAWSAARIRKHALRLFDRHKLKDWAFGFDFAPNRGGICHFNQQVITLSISYCHRASRHQINDTILHEIAHALAGPGHGHDRLWYAIARRIGCSGDREHFTKHSVPRWIGHCACGDAFRRHRRTKGLYCVECGETVEWEANTSDLSLGR